MIEIKRFEDVEELKEKGQVDINMQLALNEVLRGIITSLSNFHMDFDPDEKGYVILLEPTDGAKELAEIGINGSFENINPESISYDKNLDLYLIQVLHNNEFMNFYLVEKEGIEFIPGLEDLIEEHEDSITQTMLLRRVYEESSKFQKTAEEVSEGQEDEENDVPF
jgi:hypothetical protein